MADITRLWLEALQRRTVVRELPALDDAERRDALSGLVAWLVDSTVDSRELTPVAAEALGGFVLARRARGQLLEEVVIELGLLETVVMEDLVSRADTTDTSARDLVATARTVAYRTTVAMTVAAGMYNEEAERERRAERRKLHDFTRVVSHEMRTPIGAAYTAARMLQDMWGDLPGEERERMLEVVGRGLSRATHLLESVMSIALAREAEPVRTRSLRALVADAVAEAQGIAGEAGVRIEVPGSVPNAPVDARRVGLILKNLVGNAVQFADPSKADRWVRIRVERDKGSYGWLVQVDDNGTGIHRDQQEKIFRRFYRAHTDLADGTGLGLVIVREAAEQMGGDVTVESVPGVGSTFSFVAPDLSRPGPRDHDAGESG